MANTIPKKFASVVAAVDSVSSEFDSKAKFRPFGPDKWIRDITRSWTDGIAHVAFVLDTDRSLLAVYVVLVLPGADDHAEALATASARANYGLLPGCFEVALDTAETRYRSVLTLVSDQISTRDVAQLLAGALVTTKMYHPAFAKIVVAGADPIEAIDEVESE